MAYDCLLLLFVFVVVVVVAGVGVVIIIDYTNSRGGAIFQQHTVVNPASFPTHVQDAYFTVKFVDTDTLLPRKHCGRSRKKFVNSLKSFSLALHFQALSHGVVVLVHL